MRSFMKKILIILLGLISFTTFAMEIRTYDCEKYEEFYGVRRVNMYFQSNIYVELPIFVEVINSFGGVVYSKKLKEVSDSNSVKIIGKNTASRLTIKFSDVSIKRKRIAEVTMKEIPKLFSSDGARFTPGFSCTLSKTTNL